ncbi:PilZ domain-containing protein [Alkalimonas sp.]|uniref:PilZ domain-containing protein n=1 Tax=Alkalimonas sp. TaxID=1872453 RepID=UPI00263ADCE0|nr:PilZ domain-containing protein [Alkalimonas sp.]MCC5827088.1 PilZ domain-containing protein [Alkalimonas sp.]
MTAPDLQEHLSIIERLKSSVQTSDFDQMFAVLTSDLPKSKQFLLKMELKRLSQPCDFFIDLRGHVDGDVRPYEYQGKTHYMDEQAIEVFEQGINDYGRFTLGVYEDVMNTDNNFRVMHRKETEARIRQALNNNQQGEPEQAEDMLVKHQARLVQFGSYINRSEERMNYSITVEIVLENGKKYSAQTTDISVQGCKLKLARQIKLAENSEIGVFFRELEQEYTLDRNNPIRYQIVEVSPLDQKTQQLRLKRLEHSNEQELEFTNFIDRFIRGNKRRYKLNLDNALDAVIVKGYEQFYVPRTSSLPVFIAVQQGKSHPQCALTTENNRASFHYFQDELQRSVLPQILSAKRLKQLLQLPEGQRQTLLFCFTHAAKGKLYFYSATQAELASERGLNALFLGFGASKKSWKVFQLSFLTTSAEYSQLHFQLPGDAATAAKPKNTNLLDAYLKPLRFIVNLTDISTDPSTSWYQQLSYDKSAVRSLNQFAHAKLTQLPFCEAIPVKYVNLRSEDRYLYKTTVQLYNAREEALPAAFSRDFSPNGMQVEMQLPAQIKRGDIIRLNLPDLQKISNKYQLSQLAYEVMAVSKSGTIMNLKVLESDEEHQGKAFFQLLIQNNRSKLTVAEEQVKHPGLAPALRNMFIKALDSFPFYLHRKGIRYEMKAVAQGGQPTSLHQLLAQLPASQEHLNIEPLIKHSAVNLTFASQLKQMKRQDPPQCYELYLKVQPQQQGEPVLSCHYDYEYKSEPEKKGFIEQIINDRAAVFCYRIWLSRTGRPDSDFIAQELSYISQYAIHKAKLLEEELWSVVGVGELMDITDELLLRLDITTEQRQQQSALRHSLLNRG